MRLLLVAMLSAAVLLGAEEGEHSGGPSIWWKWANFAMLAGILGHLGKKHLGPFFAERSARIESGLVEARKMRESSEARVKEIERKVANLESEMKTLREEARQEMASEGERIRAEAERAIAKLQSHAEVEIASAMKLARQELKAYSADLAIQLAAGQIRERMDGSSQNRLVDGFVNQLSRTQKVTH